MKMWFVIQTFQTKFRGNALCGQFRDTKCNHTFNSTQELLLFTTSYFFAIEIKAREGGKKKHVLNFSGSDEIKHYCESGLSRTGVEVKFKKKTSA